MSSTTSGGVRMHHPPHPGTVLLGLFLKPHGLTIQEVARAIGISRTALSQFVNGHTRLSLEMARRLAGAFRTSPDVWLNLQHEHDLWNARRGRARVRIRPLVAKRAAAG